MSNICISCQGSGVFMGKECDVCDGLGKVVTFNQKLINKRRLELLEMRRENSKKIIEFPVEISPHCPDF